MKYSNKILTAAIAVMVVFSFAAAVSATPGDSPADPIDILYVYPTWNGTPFMSYPDLANDLNTTVPINGSTVYYKVTKVDGYLAGSNWSLPSAELLKYANTSASDYTNNDTNMSAEIIFFDMVNIYKNIPSQNAYFKTAANNAASRGALLVSVRTGPNNNTCFMPKGFAIRDTPGMSPYLPYPNGTANTNAPNPYYNSTFTTSFFANYDDFGPFGTANATQSQQMKELLIAKYLAA